MEDGQTVSIFPDNFGSLILWRIMKEKGIKTRVIVAGYDSLVYGARLVEYNNLETETDVVNITYRENEIRVDTLPSCDYDEYLKRCKEIPAPGSLRAAGGARGDEHRRDRKLGSCPQFGCARRVL